MDEWDVVVAGAGIAGVSAIRTIAQQNGGRRVLLINGENAPPYKRTKLSKQIASGFSPGDFLLEPSGWYAEKGVTLRNGVSVKEIDSTNQRLALSDGSELSFDRFIIATGSEPLFPKTVRSHEAGSFYVLRSSDDVARLIAAANKAKRVLIDGMGVLAVEIAEQLHRMGKQVTLAGATGQLMPRQLDERAGEIMEDLIRSKGIKLRFQEEILSFEPRNKGGFAVGMIRDSAVFDMVIFCIGVTPRIDLAQAAGLDVNRGVVVDAHMQTSVANIYAAGDVAEHEGGVITELWHAAEHQGELAALNALGIERAFENPKFRLKCEVFDNYFFSVGKPRNSLDYAIDEHELGPVYQSFYYNAGSNLVGVVMVNDRDRAKEYEKAVREAWPRERVNKAFPLQQ